MAREYDEAFRLQATAMAQEVGIRKAAIHMDMPVGTLQRWVKRATRDASIAAPISSITARNLPPNDALRLEVIDWDGWRRVIAGRMAAAANKGMDVVDLRQADCLGPTATESDHRSCRIAIDAAMALVVRVESVTNAIVNPLSELPPMTAEMADMHALADKAARIVASLERDGQD